MSNDHEVLMDIPSDVAEKIRSLRKGNLVWVSKDATQICSKPFATRKLSDEEIARREKEKLEKKAKREAERKARAEQKAKELKEKIERQKQKAAEREARLKAELEAAQRKKQELG